MALPPIEHVLIAVKPMGDDYVESHPNVAKGATLGWGTIVFFSIPKTKRRGPLKPLCWLEWVSNVGSIVL